MEISTRYIKLSSKFETSKTLELGGEVEFSFWVGEEKIEGKAEVVKIEQRNNQDNTMDVVFVIKPL